MARLAHHEATDHVLELADGRRLGYAVFGDPDGAPVLNCHGGLVSRNDVADADGPAKDLGLCVISPDRPGIGLSDRKPGHALLDWVRGDLTELIDRLGVDTLAVMGWSAGGQYALATAVALADRVTRTAVIAGCLPVDDPANRAQLSTLDRRLLSWSEGFSPAAHAYFRATHAFAVRAPTRFAAMGAGDLEGDETGSLGERAEWFAQVMAEGSAHPAGAVDDYRAFGGPWGFRPEDVPGTVLVHQGTADALVPEAWAHELGRRIPGASVTIHPGGGHLIAVTHRREILEGVAGT